MQDHERRAAARRAAAVVGVDAGKFKHALVVRPRDGADSKPLLFPVDRAGFEAAAAFIRKHGGGAAPQDVLVGIEFAGVYGFTLAHYLARDGYAVVSVPPSSTKVWKTVVHGARLKTDAADAVSIADLVAGGQFQAFAYLRPELAQLRYLVSAYERVTKLRNGALSRLKSVLQVVFPEAESLFGRGFTKALTPLAFLEAYPGPSAVLDAPKRQVVALLKGVSGGKIGEARYVRIREAAEHSLALPVAQDSLRAEVPLLVAQIRLYTAQREALEAAMERSLAAMPEATALRTIPAVSAVTAAVFLGSIGDPRAYASARQVLKLAGLSLVEHSSGIRQGGHHISKHGRALLRKHAYLFAMRSVMTGGLFRPAYDRMVARGKPKKLALTALSRAAVELWFAVARDLRTFTPAPPGSGVPAGVVGGAAGGALVGGGEDAAVVSPYADDPPAADA